MASAPVESTRHLRSRDGGKRSVNDADVKPPTEEDAEMAAAATASHYLGCRGISSKRKLQDGLITIHNTPKRARISTGALNDSPGKLGEELPDVYCWECHKECVEGALDCVSCPRTFHPDCMPSNSESSRESNESWTCPVCLMIMKAECADSRSWAMQQVNIDQLCTLFGFALQRMKHPDSEAFHNPVPKSLLPDYYDIVFHPMDLSTLDRNIKRKMYASTEAFIEDAKWILHNSMIYNGATSKYTADAKMIIKICKHEMSEIELCPDCYMNSCIRKDNWFAEPCTFPHCLVWAKLKGFPYWPAKALRVSASNNVDVRFFGAHDRAWIPINQVYLLSEECPNPIKNVKKFGLDKAVDELQLHLRKLRLRPNVEFHYAPFKTEFKIEHLYNCSLLFGSSLAGEQLSTAETRAARERRRHTSGEDSCSVANSEDLSERSLNSSGKFELPTTVGGVPENNVGSKTSGTPPSSNESTPRKIMKAKKQISRPTTAAAAESKSASVNGSPMPTTTIVSSNVVDDENISVLEKIRLAMDHIDDENEDSNCSNNNNNNIHEEQSFFNADEGVQSPKEDVDSNFRDLSQSPDSTSPALDASPKPPVDEAKETILDESNAATVVRNDERNDKSLTTDTDKITTLNVVGQQSVASNSGQEPTVRKRNLQSVLEKMHSHVQQQRCSVSPSNSDTGAAAGATNANGSTPAALNAGRLKKETKSTVDKSSIVERYSEQINNFLHATVESMLDELGQSGANSSPTVVNKSLKKDETSTELLQEQFAKMKWFYQEAIRAMKNTAKVTFTELQHSVEAEKNAAYDETRRKFDEELAAAVKEAKLKQWCANCGKEAVFYCCWNTSYCDYPCQQRHWPKHQATCAQIRQTSAGDHSTQQLNTLQSNPSSAATFASVTSSLQFAGGSTGGSTNNNTSAAATPSNVVPLYAVPAAGYYKTAAIPAGSTVALDLNSTTNGQFIAIQPRTTQIPSSAASNAIGSNVRRR